LMRKHGAGRQQQALPICYLWTVTDRNAYSSSAIANETKACTHVKYFWGSWLQKAVYKILSSNFFLSANYSVGTNETFMY
jgi:hypothetical protein